MLSSAARDVQNVLFFLSSTEKGPEDYAVTAFAVTVRARLDVSSLRADHVASCGTDLHGVCESDSVNDAFK